MKDVYSILFEKTYVPSAYITTSLHPTAIPALKISAVRLKEHSAKMVLGEAARKAEIF